MPSTKTFRIGNIPEKEGDKTNVVYMITYAGKRYVGQTDQSLHERMSEHHRAIDEGHGDGKKFIKYYKKHDFEDATVKILYHGRSDKYLNQKEKFYIKKYNTVKNGLNTQKGNST